MSSRKPANGGAVIPSGQALADVGGGAFRFECARQDSHRRHAGVPASRDLEDSLPTERYARSIRRRTPAASSLGVAITVNKHYSSVTTSDTVYRRRLSSSRCTSIQRVRLVNNRGIQMKVHQSIRRFFLPSSVDDVGHSTPRGFRANRWWAATGFLLLSCVPATAATVTVTHDSIVTINFQLPRVPTSGPDTLTFGFWDGGTGGTGIPKDTAALYNGATLLGNTATLPPFVGGSLAWKSPSSLYAIQSASVPVIDFSSILNATISGRIIFVPGVGRSLQIDAQAMAGQPYSVSLFLGKARADGSLVGVTAEQPVITSITFASTTASPSYSLTPKTWDFGTQPTNAQTPAVTFTLANTGNVPLTISLPVLMGSNPGDYLFSPGNTCAMGSVVVVGSTCYFGAAFSPIAIGTRTAEIRIDTSPPTASGTVILTGTGSAAPTTPGSVYDKCASSNFGDWLLSPLRQEKCGAITFLRNWFAISNADASPSALFDWLGVGVNAQTVVALKNEIILGQQVKIALDQGSNIPWNNTALSDYITAVNKATSFAATLNSIGNVFHLSNPTISFVARVAPIVDVLSTSFNTYNTVAAGYVGNTPYIILNAYINARCGNITTCGDDTNTYENAQAQALDFQDKIDIILCTAHPVNCNNPSKKQALLDTYLKTLELQYQAFRLVAYPQGVSTSIRYELGRGLVKIINNP